MKQKRKKRRKKGYGDEQDGKTKEDVHEDAWFVRKRMISIFFVRTAKDIMEAPSSKMEGVHAVQKFLC